MSLKGLFESLDQVPAYQGLLADIRSGKAPAATLLEFAKPFVISALWRELGHPALVLCPRPEDARRMTEQLQAYCGDDAPIFHFAESEVLPYERLALDLSTVHLRLSALGSLRSASAGQPPLIVASTMALMQQTLSPDLLGRLTHTVRRGEKIALEPLLEQWARMGYRFVPGVEEPGTASRRGGIIDIFAPGDGLPVRIDLWGDEVESVRLFDPATQRSVEQVESVTIPPAWEVLPAYAHNCALTEAVHGLDYSSCRTAERDRISEELAELVAALSTDNASFYAGFFHAHTLLDHLSGDTVVMIDEPSEAAEAARHWEASAAKLRFTKEERGELPQGFPVGLAEWAALSEALDVRPSRLAMSRYHAGPRDSAIALPFGSAAAYHGQLEALTADLGIRSGSPVVIATQHSRRLEEVLRQGDVPAQETRSLDALPASGTVGVVHLSVAGGWTLRPPEAPEALEAPKAVILTLLTDAEVFGNVKRRVGRTRSKPSKSPTITLDELSPGGFVVHIDHGIARFVGTQAMAGPGEAAQEEDGATTGREYLVLQYAEGDKLYVPMEHLDRVSPYAGGEDTPPSLTRLGTQEWGRSVARARESTKKLAVDLVAIYAQRELAEGHAHSPDTPWQRELEDSFPFVETPDQAVAIYEVKEDMETARPMDRLVCGDVGYGKTEVALRAAFKTVMDGKQVAVLVPTTLLAQQHHATFAERLSPFPVRLEALSRFRTDREQEVIIDGLKAGEIDIVIGTHRLVQRDVGFKDLGLVIVDEEHRFGVNHKEHLKELRREVDVLTMTATPIPRTLHMTLAGVRDISTIETPPEDRVPIKTYLAEASDELVREAILRELDRGGQVFFLHNRVKTIALVADHVRQLVPEARVLVAHGQMPEDQLSDVMADFADGGGDVLVCTTIIESGLDIPSVNTLIVDRADRLGLAQLYQLRGRIGRRSHRGYAYLLVPPGRRLTDAAQRRLQTIVAATELGAGFRIAMKDLEIRGAGNILGAEQSGHIHAVGFDLYTRLLAEAVQDLRAQTGGAPPPSPERADPQVDLGIAAAIPEEMVEHVSTRMALYQRMASAHTSEDVDDLAQEFRDRFGHRLPEEVHHLLYSLRVKAVARTAGVESVTRRDDVITLKLRDEVGGAKLALQKTLGYGTRVGNQQVHLPVGEGDVLWGQALLEVLERLEAFMRRVPEMAPAASG